MNDNFKEYLRLLPEPDRESLAYKVASRLYECSTIRHAMFVPNDVPRLFTHLIKEVLDTELAQQAQALAGAERALRAYQDLPAEPAACSISESVRTKREDAQVEEWWNKRNEVDRLVEEALAGIESLSK